MMVDSTNNDTAADTYAKDDAQFQKIATTRYMYNAEKCGKAPLVGYLLNLLDMPPIERGGKMVPWSAFLIKTTRPTRAVDRDKDVVEVPAGSEVLIPATFELASFFTKAATNEDKIFEVKIIPEKQIDIGKGQKMWSFDLAAKPEPMRRAKFGLAAVLAPPMLTAGNESASGDETPF